MPPTFKALKTWSLGCGAWRDDAAPERAQLQRVLAGAAADVQRDLEKHGERVNKTLLDAIQSV